MANTTAHRIHRFDSTGEAYDACQCDERIKTGDVLIIESERVVGIADTWPVAVTVEYGNLHITCEGVTVEEYGYNRQDRGEEWPAGCVEAAKAEAARLGYAVRS